MEKKEFEELIFSEICTFRRSNYNDLEITDEDWELIRFVYDNHPLFFNKYQLARAYNALGINLFKSLKSEAERFGKGYDAWAEANNQALYIETAFEANPSKQLKKALEIAKKQEEMAKTAFREMLKPIGQEDSYVGL